MHTQEKLTRRVFSKVPGSPEQRALAIHKVLEVQIELARFMSRPIDLNRSREDLIAESIEHADRLHTDLMQWFKDQHITPVYRASIAATISGFIPVFEQVLESCQFIWKFSNEAYGGNEFFDTLMQHLIVSLSASLPQLKHEASNPTEEAAS